MLKGRCEVLVKPFSEEFLLSLLEAHGKSETFIFDQLMFANMGFCLSNWAIFQKALLLSPLLNKLHPGLVGEDIEYVSDFCAPLNLENCQIHLPTQNSRNHYGLHIDTIDRSVSQCYNLWLPFALSSDRTSYDGDSILEVWPFVEEDEGEDFGSGSETNSQTGRLETFFALPKLYQHFPFAPGSLHQLSELLSQSFDLFEASEEELELAFNLLLASHQQSRHPAEKSLQTTLEPLTPSQMQQTTKSALRGFPSLEKIGYRCNPESRLYEFFDWQALVQHWEKKQVAVFLPQSSPSTHPAKIPTSILIANQETIAQDSVSLGPGDAFLFSSAQFHRSGRSRTPRVGLCVKFVIKKGNALYSNHPRGSLCQPDPEQAGVQPMQCLSQPWPDWCSLYTATLCYNPTDFTGYRRFVPLLCRHKANVSDLLEFASRVEGVRAYLRLVGQEIRLGLADPTADCPLLQN